MDDDGWDLHAVFRSSAASISVPDAAAPAPVNALTDMDLCQEGFYRLMSTGNDGELVNFGETLVSNYYRSGGLEEVYMQGCAQPSAPSTAASTTTTTTTTVTSTTCISFDGGGSAHEQPLMFGDSISFSFKSVDSDQSIQDRKRKSKKKKKRVVELREEELSNDGWAWRKYGQKPIKGSPHPRCSTTKDCLARKHVERNPTDTSKFIVSYSGGDHIHPRPAHLSSLAGTTRSTTKFSTVEEVAAAAFSSSPTSTTPFK